MSLPTTKENFCPRCKVDFELPIEANYCPTCGSLLQKIEEKKDKYQIVYIGFYMNSTMLRMRNSTLVTKC